MNKNLNKDMERLNAVISDETIFSAEVCRLGHTESGADYMMVTVPATAGLSGGYTGIIHADEADGEIERQTLVPLMGRVVPFTIIGIDTDKGQVICSRRKAQEIIKLKMFQDLIDRKVFEGRIINFTRYGAYVEVNGISGLLKNSDFSTDHSEVSERYAVGDAVTVRCKEIGQTGKISWETLEKFTRSEPLEYDFEVDTVVLGTVVNIRVFERGVGVFVRIGKGLDALCPMPQDREVELETRVSVKISSIEPGATPTAAPRVRGKIVRIL